MPEPNNDIVVTATVIRPPAETSNVANGSTRSPVISDPYLGTVYGNVLDSFENPTYNITLSVIKTPVQASNASTSPSSTNSRADTPAGNASSAGGNATTQVAPGDAVPLSYRTIPANERIVIAQTGVTAVQISELEIKSSSDNKGGAGYLATEMRFDLFQPGAANLIDQIQIARAYLGDPSTNAQFAMLVEVSFVGYSHNPENEDSANRGVPVIVDGPHSWVISLTEMTVSVDQTGSRYECKAGVIEQLLYNDRQYRIPSRMFTLGRTIREHANYLAESLTAWTKANQSNAETPDEYVVDLSMLLGNTSPLIKNDEIFVATDNTVVRDNVIVRDPLIYSTRDTARFESLRNATGGGYVQRPQDADIMVNGSIIEAQDKEDFYAYFCRLLSMCPEFLQKISTIDNPSRYGQNTSAGVTGMRANRLFLHWFGIEMDVEYIKWDRRRADYAKKIIIRPVIYKDTRSDLFLTVTDDVSGEIRNAAASAAAQAESMRQSGSLLKSYYYSYTGLNDQILNLEMKLDPALNVMQAPRADLVKGTVVANLQSPINNANAAVGLQSLTNIIDTFKNAAKFGRFLDTIKNLPSAQLNRIVQSIASSTSISPEQLSSVIQRGTEADRQALASRINSATSAQLARAVNAASSNTSPTAPLTRNPDGSVYDPELAGVTSTFADDLVQFDTSGFTVSQLIESGFIDISNIDPSTYSFDLVPPVSQAASIADSAASSGGSQLNSTSTTLFNTILASRAGSTMLNTVELSIRGDPWYLGRARGKSVADQMDMSLATTNHFLLQVASPPLIDLDADEDKNTGIWKNNQLNNTLSGVYSITNITNKFSNGVFTTSLDGTKLYLLPLQNIKPAAIGVSPDLLDDTGNVDFRSNVAQRNNYLIRPATPPVADPAVADPGAPSGGTSRLSNTPVTRITDEVYNEYIQTVEIKEAGTLSYRALQKDRIDGNNPTWAAGRMQIMPANVADISRTELTQYRSLFAGKTNEQIGRAFIELPAADQQRFERTFIERNRREIQRQIGRAPTFSELVAGQIGSGNLSYGINSPTADLSPSQRAAIRGNGGVPSRMFPREPRNAGEFVESVKRYFGV